MTPHDVNMSTSPVPEGINIDKLGDDESDQSTIENNYIAKVKLSMNERFVEEDLISEHGDSSRQYMAGDTISISDFSLINRSEISYDVASLRKKEPNFDKEEENANELGNLPKRKVHAKHVPETVRGKHKRI